MCEQRVIASMKISNWPTLILTDEIFNCKVISYSVTVCSMQGVTRAVTIFFGNPNCWCENPVGIGNKTFNYSSGPIDLIIVFGLLEIDLKVLLELLSKPLQHHRL